MTASRHEQTAKEIAFNFGAMFVRALQGDYSLVDLYAREYQIEFEGGRPYLQNIAAALTEARAEYLSEIEGKMEGLKQPNAVVSEYYSGYNKAIADVLKIMRG